MTLVFLHGLESGPHGSKYQALTKEFGEVLAPDCTGLTTIEARLEAVEAALEGKTNLTLVGSSFGGWVALRFAQRHPERVTKLVLCAPAVSFEPGIRVPRGVPCAVLQGTQDTIVLPELVEQFAENNDTALILVEDEHRLEHSTEWLLRLVRWDY